MANAQQKKRRLHSALDFLLSIADLNMALSCAIQRSGNSRPALNLTDTIEADKTRILRYSRTIFNDVLGYDQQYENPQPIYAKKHVWRVHFGAVDGRGHAEFGPEVTLDSVADENQGLRQLERIAHDLQAVYHLPYQPALYREGRVVEKVA